MLFCLTAGKRSGSKYQRENIVLFWGICGTKVILLASRKQDNGKKEREVIWAIISRRCVTSTLHSCSSTGGMDTMTHGSEIK